MLFQFKFLRSTYWLLIGMPCGPRVGNQVETGIGILTALVVHGQDSEVFHTTAVKVVPVEMGF